jgi:hypothetical protein
VTSGFASTATSLGADTGGAVTCDADFAQPEPLNATAKKTTAGDRILLIFDKTLMIAGHADISRKA